MKNNLRKCLSCATCKYVEKRTDIDCPFVNYFCFLENQGRQECGIWYTNHRINEQLVCDDWKEYNENK